MDLTLYCHPGSCARVTMIAIEEAGLSFKTELVRFMKQEHLSEAYLARNPLGKVPSLSTGAQTLRENVAILLWLNESVPEAKLLPPANDAVARAEQVADLCFCSSTLHPIVTRIALPMMFGPADAIPGIRAAAEAMMRRFFQVIEDRLADRPYWYGTEWSIMDAYVGWVFSRIASVGFDASAFPRLTAMVELQSSRPSVQRAAAREAEQQAQLVREGAAMPAQRSESEKDRT
jgi:glutathione S-transferase